MAIANIRKTFQKALAKGVNIGLGTDAAVYPHGRNAEEFHQMADLGMKPIDALKAGTSSDAELLGHRGQDRNAGTEQARRRRRGTRQSRREHPPDGKGFLRHERRRDLPQRSKRGGTLALLQRSMQARIVRRNVYVRPVEHGGFRTSQTISRRSARSCTSGSSLLSEEQFWRNPFPYGNDIGHLVLHLTGNLNYYIGAKNRRLRVCARSRPRICRDGAAEQSSRCCRVSIAAIAMVARNRSQTIRGGLGEGVFGGRRHVKEPICDCSGLRSPRRSSRRPNDQPEPRIVAQVERATQAASPN